jgi:hypothetical protein
MAGDIGVALPALQSERRRRNSSCFIATRALRSTAECPPVSTSSVS